jgi:hypothetical protein
MGIATGASSLRLKKIYGTGWRFNGYMPDRYVQLISQERIDIVSPGLDNRRNVSIFTWLEIDDCWLNKEYGSF